MITMENYEGWLMRYADNELDGNERRMVETFLAEHPDLKEELDEVSAVRVTPVLATMPGKERLMKHEATAFAWWRVAAAVALLVVAGTTLIFLNRQPTEETLVAEVKPVPVIIESKEAPADTMPIIKPTMHKQDVVAVVTDAMPEKSIIPADSEEEPLLADIAEPQSIVPDSVEPEPTTLPQVTATIGIVITDARLAVNPWLEMLTADNE